jgi:hypothetical protein
MVESIMIKDIDTNQELNMDKFNTPGYILDYVDWGQATVNYNTSQYVNQIGVTVISASYKSRSIDISGFIVAESESQMTERKRLINGFFVPMHEYLVKYREFQIKVRINSSVRYTNTEETSNNECICRFKISGMCPYPLFTLFRDVQINVGKYVDLFHFPFYVTEEKPILFAVRSIGEYRKRIIKNTGQIPIGFKFTMEATDGSVENPTLYNFTTDEHFTIEKTLVEGEVVEINTNAGFKSIMGRIGSAQPTNYFQYMSADSSWLNLIPGNNLIGYNATSGEDSLKITMEISPQFVEVQECF